MSRQLPCRLDDLPSEKASEAISSASTKSEGSGGHFDISQFGHSGSSALSIESGISSSASLHGLAMQHSAGAVANFVSWGPSHMDRKALGGVSRGSDAHYQVLSSSSWPMPGDAAEIHVTGRQVILFYEPSDATVKMTLVLQLPWQVTSCIQAVPPPAFSDAISTKSMSHLLLGNDLLHVMSSRKPVAKAGVSKRDSDDFGRCAKSRWGGVLFWIVETIAKYQRKSVLPARFCLIRIEKGDTTKKKKGEIARLECELQEKLKLAKSLEEDNKVLQRKERLLALQVSNGERQIMCHRVEVKQMRILGQGQYVQQLNCPTGVIVARELRPTWSPSCKAFAPQSTRPQLGVSSHSCQRMSRTSLLLNSGQHGAHSWMK